MPAGIGAANLIIADKRSDGYVQTNAWGLDFPMSDIGHSRIITPFQNLALEEPVWDLNDVIWIPELGCIIQWAWPSAADMDLSDWNQDASAYWKEVRPPGQRRTFIKYYDGRPNQTGKITLATARFPRNPSWQFRFLRAEPPLDQSYGVGFYLTLNATGTVQYQWRFSQRGSESADISRLDLLRSSNGGSSWGILDHYGREDARRWLGRAFGLIETITCFYLPDHIILYLGDLADPWIFYEPGLDIPEGHPQVQIGGGHMAFHFESLMFASSAAIRRETGITPPEFITEIEDTVTTLAHTPPGTSIKAYMDEDADGNLHPEALMEGYTAHTAVLWGIQATRPATHAEPVTTTLFDNVVNGSDQGRLNSVEFGIAKDWRGSWFRAEILTLGEYGFSGNEKTRLRVALQTGALVEWTTQVTGYLDTPKITRQGTDPGAYPLMLEARDMFCRLQIKGAPLLPSFGGWSFADAWLWLMHECAGIPESMINLDEWADEFIYPCPLGQLILKFDDTSKVARVADELAHAAGREWGVDQNGELFTRPLGSVIYSGTPDWTLDEDTITEADIAYFVELERDIFACRNHIMCIGRTPIGGDLIVSWRNEASMSDPDAIPFIGDEWTEVIQAPDGANPYLIAQFTGSELQHYGALISWQTEGKPTLFPDHFVSVQVSGLGIPIDSTFRIIEKWGRLDPRSNEFITKFLGALV